MRTAEVVLPGETRSAHLARRFLIETLDGWEVPGYIDAGALVLSELVANAALHARTDIGIRMQLSGDSLRLEVSDGSARRPIPRHYSAEATTGRGLGLVGALSQRWGVAMDGEGKTVWAELTSDRRLDQQPRRATDVDLSSFPDLDERPSDPAAEGGPVAWRHPTMPRRAA